MQIQYFFLPTIYHHYGKLLATQSLLQTELGCINLFQLISFVISKKYIPCLDFIISSVGFYFNFVLILYNTSRLPGFAREEGREGGREGGEGGRGGRGEREGGREEGRGREGGGWRGREGRGRGGREGGREGPERSRQSDRQHYVISRHRTSSGSF